MEQQDRSRWNREAINEGVALVHRALGSQRFGRYTLQAAIAAVHAEATDAAETDWREIVAIFDALVQLQPSPVVSLNRAVAIAMRDGPQAGLLEIDAAMQHGELAKYHLAHAARADMLRRLNRTDEARAAYGKALELTQQEPERRFLQGRINALKYFLDAVDFPSSQRLSGRRTKRSVPSTSGATQPGETAAHVPHEESMKYLCFGYYDKDAFDGWTDVERDRMFDTCFAYDDHLRVNGHYLGGEALQPSDTALTLSRKNGTVAITDGPFTETKEQLGGVLILEARDMNHAVQLMSQHPALTYGNSFEIRPVGDMTAIVNASEQRRAQTAQ